MNELQIFESDQFGKLRTIEIDGEPWFVGKDVATALGYKNTKDALISHVEEEDRRVIQRSEVTTLERHLPKEVSPVEFVNGNIPNRGLTIINEAGVYSLSFSSKLESAKQFKYWVTHTVIPSIRKHGAYIRGQEDMDVSETELIARALIAAKKIIDEKNAILQAQKPKVAYYDAMVSCDGYTNFRETAKLFGVKERVLTNFLVDNGFCYRDKQGVLTAYAKYSNATDRPLFVKKEFMKQYGMILTQTRFTPYGRQQIFKAMENNKEVG